MRRFVSIAAIALLAAACGGGDEGGSDNGSEGGTTTPAATAGGGGEGDVATTAAQTDESDGSAPEGVVNLAVITIGDRTLEFDVTPGGITRCDPNFFGAFWVLGAGLDMLIVNEDHPEHDPPYIKIDDPDDPDVEWIADPTINDRFAVEIPEGGSQVDSFTVEGNTATGTATFFTTSGMIAGDQSTVPEPVSGTFEVTCEDS